MLGICKADGMSVPILSGGTIALALLSCRRDLAFDTSQAVGPIHYGPVLTAAAVNAVGPLLLALCVAALLWMLSRSIRHMTFKKTFYWTWGMLILLNALYLVRTATSWIIM